MMTQEDTSAYLIHFFSLRLESAHIQLHLCILFFQLL